MGAEPWFDAVDLLPGQEWEPTIRQALRRCTHFIALISQRSVDKRGFVQNELRTAFELLRELPPGDIFLIPVRLEQVEPRHEELRRIHWVDLFVDRTGGLEKIARSLQLTVRPAMHTTGESSRPAAAREIWSKQRFLASTRWFGIGVNDLLPEYETVAACLRGLGVEGWYRFTDYAVNPPPPPPKFRVIVADSHIGMTPLRPICTAVASTGEWFIQLWSNGMREDTVAVGAYGYGGRRAARLDTALLRELKKSGFTKAKLQRWIEECGVVLDADYPRSDD